MDNRVKGLDLLRLLAVMAVMLFHYAYRGAAADHMTTLSVPDWRPVAQYGYLGVDLFFVISGFVIARQLRAVTCCNSLRRVSSGSIRRSCSA